MHGGPAGPFLRPFDPAEGSSVLRWVTSDDDARRWASLPGRTTDASIFDRWHAEPGVRPYVYVVDGAIVGYGEIWEDPEENEAELARLIVDAEQRGRGLGRQLASSLLAEARRLGWSNVWLRVVP